MGILAFYMTKHRVASVSDRKFWWIAEKIGGAIA
jgi:hypothetical protein